ncbi:MAG TPA: alpha/beta hydrolase [Burkholderiales bacterium]|nr:alpha/beta hydrolase [Burkholderiales bacterium]
MKQKLDPQVAALLERMARTGTPPYRQLGVDAARELYRMTRFTVGVPHKEPAQTEDLAAEGPAGAIPLRLYRPAKAGADEVLPCVVYFHGGGWVLGDLSTHDEVCRGLTNLAHCAVVAVDYRLAPEHKFPAAVEDAIAATQWIVEAAGRLRIDASRVAVAGDSAGGTLATVTAIAARDAGGPPLVMQALIYPSTDMTEGTESHELYAEGYGLTRENILWFREHYLSCEADACDWRASPLLTRDLSGLPPAYILTAGFDPLRDEAWQYAQRLQEAGVRVTYECFEGMIHGFIIMGGAIAAARHAIYRVAQALRPALSTAPVRL